MNTRMASLAYDNYIFDFDGTLVDSAPGILDSIEVCLQRSQLRPAQELSASLIGPPLLQMLAVVAGTDDPKLIECLAATFMEHYDSEGCLKTIPYPGVDATMHDLARAVPGLFLATNKRWRPTEMILARLGWADLFTAVYSLDSLDPIAHSKAELLDRITARHGLAPVKTVYVGDRLDDQLAAEKAGLHFLLAGWGYEAGSEDWIPAAGHILDLPSDLLLGPLSLSRRKASETTQDVYVTRP